MRRITSLTLALILSGCGYNTWWNPSFTGGYNPNLPVSDSENLRRALGQEASVSPLTTEPGDIWPGPLPPAPTLKDLETAGGLTPQPEAPVPGSPLSRGRCPGDRDAPTADALSFRRTPKVIATAHPARRRYQYHRPIRGPHKLRSRHLGLSTGSSSM